MAQEDTRQLLRIFGVAVTNFEDRSAQILERAKQLRQAGDAEGFAALLKEVAAELGDLQGKWLQITDHIIHHQQRWLADLTAVADEWPDRRNP